MADLLALPAGTKAIIMAPLVRGRKGEHKETLATVRREGFVRVRIDGEVVDVEQAPPLAPRKNHTIEAVVDRVVIRPGLETRLAESIELAIRHGEGAVVGEPSAAGDRRAAGAEWKENLFSTLHACPDCKLSFEELEPRSFSFNSPYGACPECEGLGYRVAFDPELVIPDPELSLADGAIAPWKGSAGGLGSRHREELADFVAAAGRRLVDAAGRSGSRKLASSFGRGTASRFSAWPRCWKSSMSRPPIRPSTSGWKRFAATWPARPAAAPGCGPKPAPVGWRAKRFTRSRL